jgi:hypothetical protein
MNIVLNNQNQKLSDYEFVNNVTSSHILRNTYI